MSNIDPARHPLLQAASDGARWEDRDVYPASPHWADEHERWLAFVYGKREFERYLPRLRDQARHRQATLAEIAVGYFLETRCDLPIVGFEPPGADRKTGEFLIRLPDGRDLFVEVKNRGWQDEVVEMEGWGSPRLDQPKYIDCEVRATAPWRSIRETVKKAHPKMPNTMPTLLVIPDDLFVRLSEHPHAVSIALYASRGAGDHTGYLAENGSFVGSTHERLGGLGVLSAVLPAGGSVVEFSFNIYDNVNCLPAVAIPQDIFHGYPRDPRAQE